MLIAVISRDKLSTLMGTSATWLSARIVDHTEFYFTETVCITFTFALLLGCLAMTTKYME